MENITRIQNSLQNKEYTLNPASAVEDLGILAGHYGWVSDRLSDIYQRKPKIWNEMRKNHKSDKACEREYQATSDGIDELYLKLQEKKITKLMSALRSIINLANNEAHNLM